MEGMVFNSLRKLLEPCLPEEFLAADWGTSHRHIRGWQGKFAHLLPWPQLNEILSRHRLDYPRLRLMQDGKSLATSSYLRHISGGKHKVSIPRLRNVSLTKQLREGATLVLDAVDELYGPLEELAQGLELCFRERIQINAYAGWQTSRGFDLHWDDHDVFILQVTGRKRWSVYGMTRPSPLAKDVETGERPTHAPLWEETLVDGDFLYIPRGCWHIAMPLAEPTLHLTVGIHNRTGVDLLHWLADKMRASETFRRDLPRLSDSAERASHMHQLREELLSELDQELLDSYYADLDRNALPRAQLSLPWSATTEILPSNVDALLRWTPARPLDLRIEAGVIEFACHQQRWRFAAAALGILSALESRRVCSLKELCELSKDELEEQTVRAFLSELVQHGLLTIAQG